MTQKQWASLKSLFNRALDLEGSERQEFLRQLHASDPTLARELEGMLRGAEGDSWVPPLSRPESQAAAPDPSPRRLERVLQAGDKVDNRYVVEEFLGAGGMGEVYRVFDEITGDMLAIKTLRAELAVQEEFVQRLTKELQLARRIRHASICPVYHINRTAGPGGAPLAYLLMQYLPGETLEARLRRGPLDEAEARRIIQQVMDGLEAAHAAGVIHRDLKSGNVMLVLQPDGTERVVLTDFGLALDQQATPTTASLFGEGAVVGTAAYMAPEQLLGEHVTELADIHALGVLLFEMVTGEHPFQGKTMLAIALRRLNNPAPAPRDLASHVSEEWNRTTLACLSAESDLRPATVAAVRERLAGQEPPPPPPSVLPAAAIPARPRRTGRWLVGASLAALAGIGLTAELRHVRAAPSPAAERSFKLGEEFVQRRTGPDLRNAIQEYQKAVRENPEYAEAWAGLSEAWAATANFGMGDAGEAMRQARLAADRATALDQNSARAVGMLGYCLSLDINDWPEAEAHLKRAVDLDPKRPRLRLYYASYLGKTGRRQEAIAQLLLALQEDPSSFALNQQLSVEYLGLGEYRKALQAAQELIRLQPYQGVGYLAMARADEFLGRYKEGLAACDQAALYLKHPAIDAMRAQLHAASGNRTEAARLAGQLDDLWQRRQLEGALLAKVYMGLGDRKRTITVLRESAQRREPSLLGSLLSPNFMPLLADPEYARFVSGLGIDLSRLPTARK